MRASLLRISSPLLHILHDRRCDRTVVVIDNNNSIVTKIPNGLRNGDIMIDIMRESFVCQILLEVFSVNEKERERKERKNNTVSTKESDVFCTKLGCPSNPYSQMACTKPD
jgi:hypothetical protein